MNHPNKWRCGNCGYRLETAEPPPGKCPGCGRKCEWIDDNPYVPGLSRKDEVYTCTLCGTQVKYVKDGGGVLKCCDHPMRA